MGWVDFREGERRAALGAFVALLAITAAHTLIETARDALFLAKLPASQLPWVYLGIAVVGLAFSRLRGGSRKRPSVAIPLAASALITAGFWAASGLKHSAFLYALYLWSGIFGSWVIVQFWLLLGGAFTVAQAKRLFGFIGTGSVLGAVLGAAGARLLAGALPAEQLLIAASVLLALTAAGPARWVTAAPVTPSPRGQQSTRPTLAADLRLVREHPYTLRLLGLVFSATLVFTLIDYLFKSWVARSIPDAELGAFFANVSVVLNTLALLVQLLAAGGLLRIFGVHRVVLLLPVLIVIGSLGLLVAGTLAAALVLKGFDGALRHSLHRTATELLFVPLPDAIRPRAKPFVDLVGQRGGQAFASLGLLLAAAAGVPEWVLTGAVLVLALTWITGVLGLRTHYLDMFRSAIWEGRIDDRGDLPPLDLDALEALITALNSTKDPEVICALDLLAAQRKERLIPALILYHPSRSVVLRALQIFEREQRADFLPIAERLIAHGDPEIRAAAVRARIATHPDEGWIRGLLEDAAPEVRLTALVAVIERGLLPEEEVRTRLDAELAAADSAAQLALARAISRDPSPALDSTLERLLGSSDPEVCIEAAWAAGKTGRTRFVAALLPLLCERVPSSAARDALVQLGPEALAALDRALGDEKNPLELRESLPRAIAAFPAPEAGPILLSHLSRRSEGLLGYRILRALAKVGGADPSLDRQVLLRIAGETLRRAVLLASWAATIERAAASGSVKKTAAFELLATMIEDKERHALSRMLLLLGLLHPAERFDRIQRTLGSKNAKTRASSRELIENVVDPSLRQSLVAMLEDLPAAERVERASPQHRAELLELRELLAQLAARDDELGSLAAYHARELGLRLPGRERSSSNVFSVLDGSTSNELRGEHV